MNEMLELDIASSLESVGVYPGDILMIHGDAGVHHNIDRSSQN